jgi:hypothetical protein
VKSAVSPLLVLSVCLAPGWLACGEKANCQSHYRRYCVEGQLYWQNSCAEFEELISVCPCGCADDQFSCRTNCGSCEPDCAGKECGKDPHAGLRGGAWSEGWHTTGIDLDYAYDLGVRSNGFIPGTLQELVALLESEFQTDTPVSVFMDAYDNSGGHNVHRNNYFSDGAIVVNPQENPHYYLFRFADQAF